MKEEGVKTVLDEQVCLVTGASRGIGEAISRCFHRAGARLVLLDVNSEGAEQIAHDLDPSGDRILCRRADVTQEQEVQGAVEQAVGRFARIDVAVNVAGIIRHLPIEQMSLEDFETMILNIYSHYFVKGKRLG